MRTLDGEESVRLGLLRFPLIVGVVFIHAYRSTAESGPAGDAAGGAGTVADRVQAFISQGLARPAVPLFFLMSGYLFFYGVAEWSPEGYRAKLKARARTLLVPFLFWNIATLAAVWLAQSWAVTRGFFSGKNAAVGELGPLEWMAAIFGIGRWPISYQFWFIRDLMVLVLLTPLIHRLNKSLPVIFLGALFCIWFFNLADLPAPAPEAAFFFSVGCLFGAQNRSLFCLDRHGVVITAAFVMMVWLDSDAGFEGVHVQLHKLEVLLGMAACLFLTRYAAAWSGARQLLGALGAASFFVYAAHEPLLAALMKVARARSLPGGGDAVLAVYFAVPVLVIGLLVGIHACAIRFCPRFIRVVSGGRG